MIGKIARTLLLCLLILSPLHGADQANEVPAEWRDVLLFGIDEEVMQVVKKIKASGAISLNEELLDALVTSFNKDVKVAILDFFAEQKAAVAEDTAREMLDDYEDLNPKLVVALLRYLSDIGSVDSVSIFRNLAEHFDNSIAASAIKALGKAHDAHAYSAARRQKVEEFLLSKLNDRNTDQSLKSEIVLVLGSLGADPSRDRLMDLVTDAEEDKTLRMYAVDSLGRIGDPAAIPVLKELFGQDDALMRAYAASALGRFDDSDVTNILIQGLKDSNWRVRLTSATGLANRKAGEALEILMYKIRKDPASAVRLESVKAVAAIGTLRSMAALRGLFADTTQNVETRMSCLKVLVEKDLAATIGVIKEVLEGAENQAVTRELVGRQLAKAKHPGLSVVFERMLADTEAVVRIHGIRGIANNRFEGLRSNIENMASDDPHHAVRKEAGLALW